MVSKTQIEVRRSDYLHLRIAHNEKIGIYQKCRDMNKIPAEVLRELMSSVLQLQPWEQGKCWNMFVREGDRPSLECENSRVELDHMLIPHDINACDHGKPASLKAVI
jgi:hypothetical protein